jgi:diguanylate cyclase (GGDEF)-like protein
MPLTRASERPMRRVMAAPPFTAPIRRRSSPRRRRSATFAFTVRLSLAIAATFAMLGIAGYVMTGDQLQRRLLATYAAEHRADAESVLAAELRARSDLDADRDIRQLLAAVARRPGVAEAILIGPDGIVRASGDPAAVGSRDVDPRIDAALRRGRAYTGREADPHADGRDFEFVMPMQLDRGRYAFEVTRDHELLDEQLRDIRRTAALLVVVGLLGAAIVFYLVGGRALVRSHRIALRRASRDGLTDLPNQREFREDLERELQSAQRHGDRLSVAAIDLDDFKLLNDRHGHAHGDAVLRRAASVLRRLRAGDRAYRVGGDEFVVLLTRTGADGARTAAQRLSGALRDAGVAASIGVSELRPGHEADTLLAEADAALYEGKRHGGGGIVHFEDVRDRVAVTRPDEVRALHRLLEDGALTTAFQPIWNLGAGTLLGVEALSRPQPGCGLSNPAQAFDVAEQVGRVRELDMLCLRTALRSAAELPPEALLFVNVAPQTLDRDEDDAWILRAVREAGLEPGRVVIEVTERFGGRTAAVLACLHRLRAQGFKLALDDVGTGNSGLEMLCDVGADFVKLDRSIVAGAPEQSNARAVLLAMATFARQTGAYVIAEGIEDDALLEFVRTVDDAFPREAATMIQGGQGYGLGRPSATVPAAGASLAGHGAAALA